ncbi:MAG: AI-2E family transporter [Ruminococcaceae bacterium]|nr:AI-2E family transporter [Oscillospiraceae bacterium]
MKISFNKKYTTIAIYAALLILFTIVCINAVIVRPVGLFSLWDSIKEIIKTIFYALVIAYFLAPVMDFFSKRALIFIQRKSENPFIRKLISLVLTFAIFLAIITVFIWYVAPQFIANIEDLGKVLTGYYNSIDSLIQKLRNSSELFNNVYTSILQNDSGTEVSLSDLINKAITSLIGMISSASSYIITFITTFVNEVKTLFVGIFLSVYFVYYKDTLINQVGRFAKAFLRPGTCRYLHHVVDDIDIKFAKFLRGKAVDSTIVGIVLYIIYKIVGMPYAEIFAVIGGVMNMIPVFGPIIASVICGFILLITSPQNLIAYIIIVVVVGVIDANFIEPKMLGDSLGLKPVWITIAIIVMSSLFGLFGMFFGVPIFAVIYTLVKEEVDRRVAMREAREAYEAERAQGAEEPDKDGEEAFDDEPSEEGTSEDDETNSAEESESKDEK